MRSDQVRVYPNRQGGIVHPAVGGPQGALAKRSGRKIVGVVGNEVTKPDRKFVGSSMQLLAGHIDQGKRQEQVECDLGIRVR